MVGSEMGSRTTPPNKAFTAALPYEAHPMPGRKIKAAPVGRSGFRDLLRRLREKWIETLIGAIVSLTLAGLGFFGKQLLQFSKRKAVDISSVSNEEALAVARQVVGSTTIQAIPFKDTGSAEQFILVVCAPSKNVDVPATLDSGMPLRVLEGSRHAFQVHSPELVAFDAYRQPDSPMEKYISSVSGVVDVEGNGTKQVYAVDREGGSSVYRVEIKLYDPLTGALYDANYAASYGDTMMKNVEFSANVSQHDAIKAWLLKMGNDFIFSKPRSKPGKTESYEDEIGDWRERQGFDFEEGTIEERDLPGNVPSTLTSSVCTLEDGQWEWMSYFKSAVFGYNKSRNVHFVLFVPEVSYDWIQEIHASDRYLWFAHSSDESPDGPTHWIRYDKSNHSVSKVTLSPSERQEAFAHTAACVE